MIKSNDDDSDSTTEKHKFVTTIDNNELYFYNEVKYESVLMLNKTLNDLTRQLLIAQITFDLQETPHIKLHINSDGGEVFGALSIVDRIKSSKVPVYSYAEGLVASYRDWETDRKSVV